MIDIILNFVKTHDSKGYVQKFFGRDWFGGNFRGRLPVLMFLLAFQSLYFPINQFLSRRGGGVDVGNATIDGNMPLLPVFVVFYALGFAMMPILPTVATWKFPRHLFQEYMIGLFTIMVLGYSIWILFPAYVTKAPISGSGFFFDLNQRLHSGDSSYGTYCAVPSSHVYYVTLAYLFFVMFNRKLLIPLGIFAVLNALSTMFTHQHYFIDVMTGLGLAWLAYALSHYVFTPAVQRLEKRFAVVPEN